MTPTNPTTARELELASAARDSEFAAQEWLFRELAQAGSELVQSASHASHDTLLRRDVSKQTATIMIVDDEPINIKVVRKYLRAAGYENFVTTSDSRLAVEIIRRERPDILLLDVMMPHVTGIHILEVVRGDRELSHLPVLILTAALDAETRSYALELGATDFLNKPVQSTELILRVKNALVLKAHYDQMQAYSKRLEQEVRERTSELVQSREELIHVLACAAEYRDQDTGNHVLRVGRYAGIIARQLGFSDVRAELIEQAAILHDLGKIGISDTILLKPGRLDPAEFEQMQRHCEYGLKILRAVSNDGREGVCSQQNHRPLQSPILRMAAIIAMSHHEKWNGSGYPLGLAGEAIAIEGRIVAVADVFDALGNRRPYKGPIPLDRCLEILEEGRAQHFDPLVLDAFFAGIDEVVQVSLDLADEQISAGVRSAH